MTTITDERAGLRTRCDELLAEMDKLTKHEKLTTSQERRFAELSEEFEMVRDRLTGIDRRAQLEQVRQAATGGGGFRIERGSGGDDDEAAVRRRVPTSEVRGRALDVIERTEQTSDLSRGVLDNVARWVERDDTPNDAMARWVLAAGDEDYRNAFAKMLRNPTMGQFEWTDAERLAFGRAQEYQRAMVIGTDASGGYLAPITYDAGIILQNNGTTNVRLRDAFTVKTITNDTYIGTTSAGVSAEWIAEAGEVADASPTLGQVSIPAHKWDAFVPFSFEVQGDARDLEAELVPLLVDAKERLEATAFILGTGTGQPTGLITAAVAAGGSTIVASTTADTYAVADVYKLKAALPARYRTGAAWLANEDVWDLTRQFSTGTGPNSAFWADFGDDTPSRLLGKPVYETSEMDGSVTASTTNYVLAYGQLRAYYVIDRLGSVLELVPHLFGASRRPTGQRGLLYWGRQGGALTNTAAVRVLNA